jgi:hypothetical protein
METAIRLHTGGQSVTATDIDTLIQFLHMEEL